MTAATDSAVIPALHLFVATADISADSTSKERSYGYNQPILRKQLIYAALKQCSDVAVTIVDTPASSLDAAASVHTIGFVRYLDTAFDRWMTSWNSGKADQFFAADSHRDGGNPNLFSAPQIAPHHDGLQRAGDSVFSQCCYYSQDRCTPITAFTSETLRYDLAVTTAAVAAVINTSNSVSYALITQPGHHSTSQSYGGYCYINQAAVAASLLRQSHARVAVLDVDYHAGNGSISIFWHDASVFVASIHADPATEFPYNMGYADQTGAHNNILNIPLHAPDATWSVYKQHLQHAIHRIMHEHKATAVVVSLGLDTLGGDPEASPSSGGGMKLCVEDYEELGAMIRAMSVPTVYIQEGGYFLSVVPYAAANTVLGRAAYPTPTHALTVDNHPLLAVQL